MAQIRDSFDMQATPKKPDENSPFNFSFNIASDLTQDRKDALSEEAFAALEKGDTERLRDLLRKGTNPNARNNQKETLLMGAARHNNKEAAEALLRKNADPDQTNEDGNTALMIAAATGSIDVARALTSSYADVTIINNEFETAADIANRCKRPGMAEELLARKQSRIYNRAMNKRKMKANKNHSISALFGNAHEAALIAAAGGASMFLENTQLRKMLEAMVDDSKTDENKGATLFDMGSSSPTEPLKNKNTSPLISRGLW